MNPREIDDFFYYLCTARDNAIHANYEDGDKYRTLFTNGIY